MIHQLILDNARRLPSKPAVILDGEATSYQALKKRIAEIVSVLQKLGIASGDRVAMYAPISIDLIAGYLAVLQIGATTAATHHTLGRTKLIHQIKHSGARVLITDYTNDLPDLINEAGLESVLLTTTSRAVAMSGVIQLSEAIATHLPKTEYGSLLPPDDLERPTSIFYTSGSTFEPKGVLVNHRIMLAACNRVTAYLQITPEDRVLSYSTLGSDYGVYNVLMPLFSGATSVVESRMGLSAEDVLTVVEREAVTAMHVFPPVFSLLANTGPEWQARIPNLRYISSSGQPLHTRHIQRIRETLP